MAAAATTSLLLEATPRFLSLPRRPLTSRGGLFLLKPPPFPALRAQPARRVSLTAAAEQPAPAPEPPRPRALLEVLKRSLLDSLAALKKPALALLLAGALVGLLGMARSFQKELDQIAEKADTSTPAGLSYVLTETTLALLRHPDCCISAYSSVDVKRSIDDGEKRFNQLSIEERGKFDEETLVNVNSIKRQKAGSQRSSGFSNEYIVITILVAAEGVHKLPSINSSGDLKTALQKLGAIPSSKILAVEVLWTPQNENDTLSERELLEDYPLLRPL
uniref:Uncharacterized protein n=1 Tax=Leersia perrieri TaxID=77586 RepID=A0A0D9VXS3_9ORYZ